MKIHQMLVNELLTQAEFRSLFLEYARERVGEASLLPVSEWPFPDAAEPVPVPVPVATGWRAMVAREVIREGDQWAPLSDPERWRPVGDSVGKQVGHFKKSRFRCDAAREVAEGPELTAPLPHLSMSMGSITIGPGPTYSAPTPPPEPGTSYVRGRISEGLTEYTDVEVRQFPLPGCAILWNGDDVPGPGIVGSPRWDSSYSAGRRNPFGGVTRPYLYAVTSDGRRSTAGEGYRILWPDEQLQPGDEFGNDTETWRCEQSTDRASGSMSFGIKVHRRRIEWGSVPVVVSTPLHDDDWLAEPPTPLFVAPTPAPRPPEPVAQTDAERRRSWRLLEPHEICQEGDRYARPLWYSYYVGANIGKTAEQACADAAYPVIRPIATERIDPNGTVHTALLGRRFLDPEETVPSERWTMFPLCSVTEVGRRAGDRIIEVTIVEVENA